jgi:peptidoglycan LD-endopeptidase LytH
MRFSYYFPVALSLITGLSACTAIGPATNIFGAATPHEQYERSLQRADLDRTALGSDWLTAAERALQDSLKITMPYRETGYFPANRPFAVGYTLNAQRGDRLLIRVETQGQQSARVFIDVFELDGKNRVTRAISAQADTTVLAWDVRRTRSHLIRIQPELLRSSRYTISITREPVLAFPVKGRDSRQISSFFGVARDGGRRRHEGIDIFAPKGTPALASIGGTIAQVGTNELGGNVVFLNDDAHGQRLYYAHLDRWNVQTGQRVSIGDTIGFVGNTGNARTTGPHLHFGIYADGEGALDPLPFVRLGRGPARQPLLPANRLGDSVRVSAKQAFVRLAPAADSPILRQLPRAAALTVVGGTTDWLRVELPDGLTGYLTPASTETVQKSIRRVALTIPTDLRDAADGRAAVVQTLPVGTPVEVLSAAGSFQLVRVKPGLLGWVVL